MEPASGMDVMDWFNFAAGQTGQLLEADGHPAGRAKQHPGEGLPDSTLGNETVLRTSPTPRHKAPTVFDNLIHKKEMPVTIGILINPGNKDGEPPKSWLDRA